MLDVKEQMVAEATINDLIVNLIEIPSKLLEARTERAHLATAIRDAEEAVAMANDKEYPNARKRLTNLENDLVGLDLEIRHQEDKFAALHSIAKLEAARLEFLTEA